MRCDRNYLSMSNYFSYLMPTKVYIDIDRMHAMYPFPTLSAIVQGVLMTGHIDGPYALDDGGKLTISEQMLPYCLCVAQTVGGVCILVHLRL